MADQKLARTIGVPTANLPQPVRSLALHGVYAVVSELPDGRCLPGVANIGWRPTVASTGRVLPTVGRQPILATPGRRRPSGSSVTTA
ncbi:riboflavin kinase [Halomonas sp.]|uniref:riboflavin kinase n=1 Tax=Halomonas sp. TaxID=1486246 RepID=UPI003970F8EE